MAARRVPLHVGLFLALTGARLSNPADLLTTGMATHYVPSSAIPALKSDLFSGSFHPGTAAADMLAIVLRHTAQAPPAPRGGLKEKLSFIETAMAPAIARLGAGGSCVDAVADVASALDDMVPFPAPCLLLASEMHLCGCLP
jgi:hypothetical protein